MLDDKKISEIISKSLRLKLEQEEAAEVKRHLRDNEDTRKFADLSKVIQDSVSHAAHLSVAGDQTIAPKLTEPAKQRLRDSVIKVAAEKIRLSQAGLIGGETRHMSDPDNLHDDNVAESSGDVRQVVSRFTLLRKLGDGGLGNVWLARDEKLNRNVAIKEMNALALQSPKAWQRFHREAEITGHLEHPNVVPLYHFGEDRKSGEPFYAMRFVGKRTLSDAITEHHDRVQAGEDSALGLHRLLSAFLDVCQAIAYAHSRGVVHRDLKPENVALDNFGQVIVLDWGLAKLADDGELVHQLTPEASISESSLAKTMEGDVVGTPLYMAPEQAAAELDKVDTKTDVYGLGAILFAILTGSAPHENSALTGELKRNLKDILKTIAESETPRPRDYRSSVPIELETICTKAMARKRHLRYETVTALADAVERWMAGQSEKQARYENLRMEGRELRADLQSTVRDLERNVRFMSRLPPIQQIITAENDNVSVWRERLATIFHGLLGANPDYQNVVYVRVDGDQFTELVRVERHTKDSTSLRVVPRSRLRTEETSDFIKSLIEHKPEDVQTSLVFDPLCDRGLGCEQAVRLVAGVPVYDDRTEEPFGVVMIDCDIDKVMRRQMSRRMTAAEVVIACDVFHIMMHAKAGQIVEETLSKPVAAEVPHFIPAIEALQTQLEFIDETNADIYGARIWLIPNKHGLMYLLRRKVE